MANSYSNLNDEDFKAKLLAGRHLSYWSFSNYKHCPAKFLYLSIQRYRPAERPDQRNAYEGAVIHAAAENWYKEPPPLSGKRFRELVQIEKQRFLKDNTVTFKSPEERCAADDEILRQQEQLLDLVRKHRLVSRTVRAEEKFSVDVHGVTIAGKIDLVLEQSPEGLVIPDWKGVKTKQFISKKQLLVYVLGAKKFYGKVPDKIGFIFTRLGYAEWLEPEEYNDAAQKELIDEFMEVSKQIAKEDFPARISFQCRWCDAKDICPAYQREVKNESLFKEVKTLRPGEIKF